LCECGRKKKEEKRRVGGVFFWVCVGGDLGFLGVGVVWCGEGVGGDVSPFDSP
jgi:hypothetical protein